MIPCISIIIPVYNTSPYLSACLDSCLSQSLDLEVLCVDDGSTDDSLAVLKAYSVRDARVKVYQQQHKGAGAARNKALQEAQGSYIAFMDSDDYYPSAQALEILVKAAETHSVDIAGGSMCMDRGGVIDFDSLHGRALDSFALAGSVRYQDYQYNYDYTRYVYRRGLLQEEGIKFPEYALFEDPPFFVQAMIAAEKFYAVPDAVYCYRHSLHDAKHWNERQACDRLRGLMDCLAISKSKGYATLHYYAAMQLAHEAPIAYVKHIDSEEVFSLLCLANSSVDVSLIKTTYPDFPEIFLVDALKELACGQKLLWEAQQETAAVYASTTYRLGHGLLYIPLKIKDALQQGRRNNEVEKF